MGVIIYAQDLIVEGDTIAASTALDMIDPQYTCEQNMLDVLAIYNATIAVGIDIFDSVQYAALNEIAQQNAMTGGVAVFTSRTMLGVDYDDFLTESEIGSGDRKPETNIASTFNLYPNPTDNAITYSWYDAYPSRVRVTDVFGRIVYEAPINNSNNIAISTDNWNQGVFIIESFGMQGILDKRTFTIQR